MSSACAECISVDPEEYLVILNMNVRCNKTVVIYHLLTESEVITGKSQTEALIYQYIKAEV